MSDLIGILYSIIPFILGLIAIALIPGKEKIQKLEIQNFKPETHILIYILAFIPLVMGFYYSMSIFSVNVGNQLFNLFNAIFLEIVGLGVMGINYRNYSIYSETSTQMGVPIDDRVEATNVSNMQSAAPYTTQSTGVIGTQNTQPVRSVTHDHHEQTQAQIPAGSVSKVPSTTSPATSNQMVGCPKCGTAIKINTSNRPVKISCPNCGIEGMVQ